MEFEFSAEEREFIRQVDQFLKENESRDVMDVSRENMAQVCDTPERRAFMKKIAERGFPSTGPTWPFSTYWGKLSERKRTNSSWLLWKNL